MNFEKYLISENGSESMLGDAIHQKIAERETHPHPKIDIPEQTPTSTRELSESRIVHLRASHPYCVAELKRILNNPKHKLAAKGFKIHDISDWDTTRSKSYQICDWDLWKIYPADARTRFHNDDLGEYQECYDELAAKCAEVYQACEFVHVDENGDWDGGSICLTPISSCLAPILK